MTVGGLPSGYFVEGTIEVLSTMTGMYFRKSHTEIPTPIEGHVISGAMMLAGKRDALLVLTADRSSVQILVAYMTGSDPMDLMEAELQDGMAELVNMIAGVVKVRLSDTAYGFQLTSPFTIDGENTRLIVKRGIDVFSEDYETDGVKLNLALYYF